MYRASSTCHWLYQFDPVIAEIERKSFKSIVNCVIDATGKDLRFPNTEDAFNDIRSNPGKTWIYLCRTIFCLLQCFLSSIWFSLGMSLVVIKIHPLIDMSPAFLLKTAALYVEKYMRLCKIPYSSKFILFWRWLVASFSMGATNITLVCTKNIHNPIALVDIDDFNPVIWMI